MGRISMRVFRACSRMYCLARGMMIFRGSGAPMAGVCVTGVTGKIAAEDEGGKRRFRCASLRYRVVVLPRCRVTAR